MAFTFGLVPFVAAIALLGKAAQSLDMAYCASINTASTSSNSSIYQSDGLCQQFCMDDFAFSVIQDSDCWCTDYEPDPSTQVDTGKCNTKCPGFPSDTCGGDGLWGYIKLDKSPKGTKSAGGGSTSTTSSPPQALPITETVHNTVTVTPMPASTTTASGSSVTPTPSVSVATVTAGGGQVSLQTVTVLPTTTTADGADSGASSTDMGTSHSGLSTGAAVGVAVGVIGAVIIAGICVFVFWFRRRRRNREEGMLENQGSQRGSSSGMMGTPTTAMASVWDGDNTSTGRRNSRLMPHDPRMDPYATNIYSRLDHNKSRESINTLQDNHDYSRKVLRTTNPDPPDQDRD
ncbi:hypothetical protein F4779DRAFT_632670 [Xylariaceae sp. FL0662B]|nr:hypothetical protein F4779DRAFT_632670 [Xylariaceae sp. FL0662B]